MADETATNMANREFGCVDYESPWSWFDFRVDRVGDVWIDSEQHGIIRPHIPPTDGARYITRGEFEDLIGLVYDAREYGGGYEQALGTACRFDVRVENRGDGARIYVEPRPNGDFGPTFILDSRDEIDSLFETVRDAWDRIDNEDADVDDDIVSSTIEVGDTVKVVDGGFMWLPAEGSVQFEHDDSYDVVFDFDPFVEPESASDPRVITCAKEQCFVPGDDQGLVDAVRYVESTREVTEDLY